MLTLGTTRLLQRADSSARPLSSIRFCRCAASPATRRFALWLRLLRRASILIPPFFDAHLDHPLGRSAVVGRRRAPSGAGSTAARRPFARRHGFWRRSIQFRPEARYYISTATFVRIQLQQAFFLRVFKQLAKCPVTVVRLVE